MTWKPTNFTHSQGYAEPLPRQEGLPRVKLATTVDEWEQIQAIFAQLGEPCPDPERTFVAIKKDTEGTVIGLQVAQMILHFEPLWVADPARGTFNVLELTRTLETKMGEIAPGSSYFINAPSTAPSEVRLARGNAKRNPIARLAELNGMEEASVGTLFRKKLPRVEPEEKLA